MDHLGPGLRSQPSNFASRLFAPQPFSHFSSTWPLALLCSVEEIEQFENLAARRWDNLGFLASATLPSWELHFLRLRPGFEISHFETNKLTGQGFWEEGYDLVQIPGSGDIVQRHHCPLTHASARFLRCWSCNLHKTRPHILCFVVEKLARCKWTGVQSNNLFIFSVRANASKYSLNGHLHIFLYSTKFNTMGNVPTPNIISLQRYGIGNLSSGQFGISRSNWSGHASAWLWPKAWPKEANADTLSHSRRCQPFGCKNFQAGSRDPNRYFQKLTNMFFSFSAPSCFRWIQCWVSIEIWRIAHFEGWNNFL